MEIVTDNPKLPPPVVTDGPPMASGRLPWVVSTGSLPSASVRCVCSQLDLFQSGVLSELSNGMLNCYKKNGFEFYSNITITAVSCMYFCNGRQSMLQNFDQKFEMCGL